jgi:hypothetical protein
MAKAARNSVGAWVAKNHNKENEQPAILTPVCVSTLCVISEYIPVMSALEGDRPPKDAGDRFLRPDSPFKISRTRPPPLSCFPFPIC